MSMAHMDPLQSGALPLFEAWHKTPRFSLGRKKRAVQPGEPEEGSTLQRVADNADVFGVVLSYLPATEYFKTRHICQHFFRVYRDVVSQAALRIPPEDIADGVAFYTKEPPVSLFVVSCVRARAVQKQEHFQEERKILLERIQSRKNSWVGRIACCFQNLEKRVKKLDADLDQIDGEMAQCKYWMHEIWQHLKGEEHPCPGEHILRMLGGKDALFSPPLWEAQICDERRLDPKFQPNTLYRLPLMISKTQGVPCLEAMDRVRQCSTIPCTCIVGVDNSDEQGTGDWTQTPDKLHVVIANANGAQLLVSMKIGMDLVQLTGSGPIVGIQSRSHLLFVGGIGNLFAGGLATRSYFLPGARKQLEQHIQFTRNKVCQNPFRFRAASNTGRISHQDAFDGLVKRLRSGGHGDIVSELDGEDLGRSWRLLKERKISILDGVDPSLSQSPA